MFNCKTKCFSDQHKLFCRKMKVKLFFLSSNSFTRILFCILLYNTTVGGEFRSFLELEYLYYKSYNNKAFI